MSRKRLYLTVTPELYADLESMAEAGDYRSACAFVTSLLRVVAAARKRRRGSLMPPVEVSEEVEALFAEYGDSEAGRRAAVIERKTCNGKRRDV